MQYLRVAEDMFDADYERLLTNLDGAVALLRTYATSFWADWLSEDRAKIADGDRYALDHLLSAFGGMGSLSDLVIHPVNGDPIHDEDIDHVNQRLNVYRHEIWTAATTMKRELNRQ
jgi:hypothetical protein